MALVALFPQLPFVDILLVMTAVAMLFQLLLRWISAVTGVTRLLFVATLQGKLGIFVVIKPGIAPALIIVARGTVTTITAIVQIVEAVAGVAALSQTPGPLLLFDRLLVAAGTAELAMNPLEAKLGILIVIEVNGLPLVVAVAVVALGPQNFTVAIIGLVAGVAGGGDLLVALIRVANITAHLPVGAL